MWSKYVVVPMLCCALLGGVLPAPAGATDPTLLPVELWISETDAHYVVIQTDSGEAEIPLEWDHPKDGNGQPLDVESFYVYRVVNGTAEDPIPVEEGTEYVDREAEAYDTVIYRVTYWVDGAESSPSNPVVVRKTACRPYDTWPPPPLPGAEVHEECIVP